MGPLGGYENGAPMIGLVPLLEEAPWSLLSHSMKLAFFKPERELSPEHDHDLGHLASKTVRNKSQLLKLHSLWYFVRTD